VLCVTTSLGTRWEAYSQTLLALNVPEWERLVVDGRRNWSPTGFIEQVIHHDADYVVHVDEDCFVQSREALLQLIQMFDEDSGLVAAGIPDGGCYYRERNPAALNLFFVVFRASALRDAWMARDSWPSLGFRNEYAEQVEQQCPYLDQDRIGWMKTEPYYPLFWSLLGSGGRFLYLREELRRERWSSRVSLPGGENLAEHLWYLREWFSDEVMPGHDCSNKSRYEGMESELRARWGRSPRFWTRLGISHAQRLIRRLQ
jgi:hypothetical protein